MAFKKSFQAADGSLHDASYWRIVFFAADDVAKTARIVFYGYKDKEARDAKKEPMAGGVKNYDIEAAVYDEYDFLIQSGANLKELGYQLAKAVKDVPQGGGDPIGFFDGATDA